MKKNRTVVETEVERNRQIRPLHAHSEKLRQEKKKWYNALRAYRFYRFNSLKFNLHAVVSSSL